MTRRTCEDLLSVPSITSGNAAGTRHSDGSNGAGKRAHCRQLAIEPRAIEETVFESNGVGDNERQRLRQEEKSRESDTMQTDKHHLGLPPALMLNARGRLLSGRLSVVVTRNHFNDSRKDGKDTASEKLPHDNKSSRDSTGKQKLCAF